MMSSLTQASPNVEIVTEQKTIELEASHVYVHCYFNNTVNDMLIRIWKTTFLVDKNSVYRSKLVHAENISFAPQWTVIPENKMFQFLLIFEALPKGCERFDLVEDIPQPGGFYVGDIMRNKKDVYHVYI